MNVAEWWLAFLWSTLNWLFIAFEELVAYRRLTQALDVQCIELYSIFCIKKWNVKLRFLQAEFEIVTPMFLGGAEHEAGAIRPASVKAEILFWWRALNYAQYAKDKTEANALEAFHKEETRLFGGPSAGQGAFCLTTRWVGEATQSIDNNGNTKISTAFGETGSGSGVNYLGYGIVSIKGFIEQSKSCINTGAKFVVELAFQHKASEADIAVLKSAIKLMGLLGGLGSRKRRGWGSLTLLSLKTGALKRSGMKIDPVHDDQSYRAPTNTNDFDRMLRDTIGINNQFDEQSAPLSCFGKNTRIHRWKNGFASALAAMNVLGNGYQLYRAWGRSENENLMPDGTTISHKNFKPDHDWFRESTGRFSNGKRGTYGRLADQLPERVNFGLPLGFEKKVEFAPVGDDVGRRASPLLFHIAKIGEEYFPIATWLNTLFLPSGSKIEVERSGPMSFQPTPSVISNYLEHIRRSNGTKHIYFDGECIIPETVQP